MPTPTHNHSLPLLPPTEMGPDGTNGYTTEYKPALLLTLAGLREYIAGDTVTVNDDHAIALLDWLRVYVQDEM